MKKKFLASLIISLFVIPAIGYSQVNQDWVRKFVGLGSDNAAGIAKDNSGNVYICGNNNWGYSTADMYTIRYNSAGTQTSGFLYNSPYNNADEARAIATDPAGNVYVAGRASLNSSTSDIVLIKYSASAIQQWVVFYNSPQNYIDDVTSMAVDASGNVYLTGNIVKGSFEYDYLTVKFNTSGVLQWAATYNGTANGVDMANDIAVDASGNVYVTGLSAGQVVKRSVVSTGYDYVTIKYNSSGAQQWVQRYNAASKNDEAKSLALDASGNVYVTGSSYPSTGGTDCATIKYNTDGVFLWLNRYNGPAGQDDAGNAIAIDPSGNACVAGYTYNSAGRGDVLTIKYDPNGAQQWLNVYDAGSGTHDIGKVMGIDYAGNVYVAAETSIPGVTNSDYLTIKYSSNGVQSWAARYNSPENQVDYPTAMVVVNPNSGPFGGAGNATIYVTGYSYGDVATIKYSQPMVIGSQLQVTPDAEALPLMNNFKLNNYPNPVRSLTNIQYSLPYDSKVTIDIYDAMGRKISTLVDGLRTAGTHVEKLSTMNLSEGVYHYQFTAHSGTKEFRQTKIITVQR
jgi:uncharacterized delta-60 repeat protein